MYFEAVSFISGSVELFSWVDKELAMQEHNNSKESLAVIQTKLYDKDMILISSANGKGKEWLEKEKAKLNIGEVNV